jgi:broad specificity phosphatase PhoE
LLQEWCLFSRCEAGENPICRFSINELHEFERLPLDRACGAKYSLCMIELKDFYYIRHGETNWNTEHRGMGQQNIPLNQRGEDQALDAARLLANEPIRIICHSPLIRAKRTAQVIAEQLRTPLVEVPELMECCWGEKEGHIKGKWTEDWIAGIEIPGAETYENFINRALLGINRALEHPAPVLIVAHGGVFWAIQKHAQLGARYELKNCAPVLLRAPISVSMPWGATLIDSDESAAPKHSVAQR